MAPTQKFRASFDKGVIIITLAVALLFAAQTILFVSLTNMNPYLRVFIVASIWLIFILCYGFHPSSYECTPTSVIVKSPFRSSVFPKNELEKVRQAGDAEMSSTIRTFGVGGLFGYYGKFYNRSLGKMTWYASKRSDWVMLATRKGEQVVLTPDDPPRFYKCCKGKFCLILRGLK